MTAELRLERSLKIGSRLVVEWSRREARRLCSATRRSVARDAMSSLHRRQRQSYEEKTFSYCRPAVINDHFDREHLREVEEWERDHLISCKCKEEGVKLAHLDLPAVNESFGLLPLLQGFIVPSQLEHLLRRECVKLFCVGDFGLKPLPLSSTTCRRSCVKGKLRLSLKNV